MANIEKARAIMSNLLTVETRRKVNALTLAAEEARSVRATETVSAIADKLLEITPYRLSAVALYYKAIACNNRCAGSPESTNAFFVLSESHLPVIRARANLALGCQAYLAGNYNEALKRYETAGLELTLDRDPVGSLHLVQMRAVLLGALGRHGQAVTELKQLAVVLKVTSTNLTATVYNLWNSLATELLHLGEVEAAWNISSRVVASPHVFAYPEWMATHEEIKRASHKGQSVTVPDVNAPSATVHSMQAYRAARTRKNDSFMASPMGELYIRSQQVDPETRQFLNKSVEVLLFHAALNARPPTRR